MSRAGWRLDGFEEIKEIGVGAQGRVVLARHIGTGQMVAIKYLASELLGDADSRQTLLGEAQLLKRVTNPHVTRLFDYVESPEGSVIVMEAVLGNDLRKILAGRAKPLSPEACLAMLKGSLLGLGAAHSVGVVHRDYKPANVLVQDDGHSKLIDFGVAVLTGQGGWSGTPAYMAPEQWQGEPASPATDLYAATCVFVECVTGAKPYPGKTAEELRVQHSSAPVPVDRLPEPLRALVTRGLAKSPAGRFWDAADFLATLETLAVREYGHDWQRRGLVTLGAATAVLGFAIPATWLGTTTLAPGGTSVGAGAGHGVTGGGKGLLAKVGGTKGAVGIGAGTAAGVAVAFFLWPSAPKVGGQASGTTQLSFARPGALLGQPNMPSAETPQMSLDMTVKPARVRAGTSVTLTTRFRARTPQGVKYLPGGIRQCFGENSKRPDDNLDYAFSVGRTGTEKLAKNESFVNFFRARKKVTPSEQLEATSRVIARWENRGVAEPYDPAICGFRSTWTDIRTFTLPRVNKLKPGKYWIGPYRPTNFVELKRDGVPIAPESVGTVLKNDLPRITVLKG